MPDGEFKLASAFVEVNLRDNTSGDEQKIRAKLEGEKPVDLKTALKDPNNVAAVKKAIEVGPAAKIRAEVDESAARESARKAGKGVDDEMQRVAARTNAQFSALAFAAAFAGLPAAAAIAGVGVAAGLSIVPLAFAGIAAAALKNNLQVSAAFSDLKSHVVSETQQMAAPMAGTLVDAAGRLGASFDRLKPQLRAAFQEARPAVLSLTDGVTGLAENAMPGFVTAIRNSNAPMQGFKSLLQQTGSGVSDFFTNLSTGASSSQGIMQTTGGIIRDLLGFAGQFFANLSNNGGPALAQFRGALSQLEGLLLSLTSGGFPLLQGAFSGFMGQVQGALGILTAVSGALGGWAGPIANIAGSLKALDMMTFGKASAGLKGMYNEMKTAEAGSATFGTGLTSTATKASIFSAGLVVLGVALKVIGDRSQEASTMLSEHKDAVSILTGAYRQSNGALTDSVKAALQTDQTFQKLSTSAKTLGINQQQLTDDVASGAGAFSNSANQIRGIASALIDSAHPFGTFGDHMRADVDHMIQFGGTANQVSGDIDTLVAAYQKNQNASDGQTAAFRNQVTTLVNVAGQYNSLSGAAKEAAAQQKLYQAYLDNIPSSTRAANQASADLATAFNKIRDSATTAADKGTALLTVIDHFSGRAPSFEEATQAVNDGIRTLGDSFAAASTKTGTFDESMLNANGTVNTLTENGSTLQDKMVKLQGGMSDAAGSINDMVKAGTPLPVALQKINDQANTTHDRFIKSAESMGFSKIAAEKLATAYGINNSEVATYISTLSAADLKAAGITTTIDNLGNTIVHLPNGKDINIGANTAGALASVAHFKDVADATKAQTTVGANIDPATGAVLDWRNTTFRTVGNTTTYTNTDPATGRVRNWQVVTDQTGAQTTTYSTTDPATGAVTNWKRNTDGSWVTVNVGANTAPARGSLQGFIDSYMGKVINVAVRASTPPGGILPLGSNATGNLLKPFASGGIASYAGGGFDGLTPMTGGLATMVPPNTWRVVGDNMRVPEAYIPVDPSSSRSQQLLSETNSLMGRDQSGSTAVMSKAPEVHIHVNGATASLDALANQVMSKIQWELRGRG